MIENEQKKSMNLEDHVLIVMTQEVDQMTEWRGQTMEQEGPMTEKAGLITEQEDKMAEKAGPITEQEDQMADSDPMIESGVLKKDTGGQTTGIGDLPGESTDLASQTG